MSDAASRIGGSLAEATGADAVALEGRATGGLSQETWFVRIRAGGSERQAVLRLPTLASGWRSIAIQGAALSAVGRADFRAPGLIAFDPGEDNPFERPFLLMERVEGEVPSGWSELESTRRTALAEQAMRLLAQLQAIDVAEAPPELRRPRGNPAIDELTFYRRRFDRLGISRRGTIETAFRWLESSIPDMSDDHVLVHDDFRMGNFVVRENEIEAVLDWELTRIGSPLSDLTWCFIAVWKTPELDPKPFYDLYADLTGRSPEDGALRWYTALGYLRLVYYAVAGGSALLSGISRDLRQAVLRLETPVRMDRLLRVIDGEPIV